MTPAPMPTTNPVNIPLRRTSLFVGFLFSPFYQLPSLCDHLD